MLLLNCLQLTILILCVSTQTKYYEHIFSLKYSFAYQVGSMSKSNSPTSNPPVTQIASTSTDHLDGAIGGLVTNERKRKLTEKGMSYEIQKRQHNLRNKVSAWRRHAQQIDLRLLSESNDISALTKEQELLLKLMNEVTVANEEHNEILSSANMAYDCSQFEEIEKENHKILKLISQFIREMNEGSEISVKSKKSHNSSRSSRSSRSSQRSNASKRANAAAEAAALKAKLKYIDQEAKQKAELERLQTMKQIDMAEAKVDAITKIEQETNASFDLEVNNIASLPDDKEQFVEDYVRSHSNVDIKQSSFTCANNGSIHVPNNMEAIPVSMQSHIGTFDGMRLDPTIREFVPRSNPVNGTTCIGNTPRDRFKNGQNSEFVDFAKSFVDQINLNRLPPPEPGIFYGDPLKYPGWESAFNSLIDQKTIPPCEKMHYLKRYLSGSARDAIEGYFLLSTEDSYNEAKKLLNQRYGDTFVIANAFRDKLDSWPNIPSSDGEALRKFSDFLRQCETAMQLTDGLHVLNDVRENRKMLAKLPDWIITRWGRKVSRWKQDGKGFPPFGEFMNFMISESNIACDPVISLQALRGNQMNERSKAAAGRNHRPNTNRYGVNSFSTKTNDSSNQNDNSKSFEPKCFLCDQMHNIDDCQSFLGQSLDERKIFIKENGLCYGCLKHGHRARTCRNRRKCKICKRNHPTSLHGDIRVVRNETRSDVKITDNKTQSNATSLSGNIHVTHFNGIKEISKSSLIIPVWLSHLDSPEREILTYALLDTQSDTTFVLDSVCEGLGLTGSETKLLLSTMVSRNQSIDTKRFEGLVIRGFDNSIKIQLPVTFSRNMIPANRSHVPTPEMASKWSHLRRIASELPPLQDCEIGLLIGYNCPKALLPREVIPPVNNGPYGQRTDIGWGIVGIVDSTQISDSACDPIGFSHRILTYEVSLPDSPKTLQMSVCILRRI